MPASVHPQSWSEEKSALGHPPLPMFNPDYLVILVD